MAKKKPRIRTKRTLKRAAERAKKSGLKPTALQKAKTVLRSTCGPNKIKVEYCRKKKNAGYNMTNRKSKKKKVEVSKKKKKVVPSKKKKKSKIHQKPLSFWESKGGLPKKQFKKF